MSNMTRVGVFGSVAVGFAGLLMAFSGFGRTTTPTQPQTTTATFALPSVTPMPGYDELQDRDGVTIAVSTTPFRKERRTRTDVQQLPTTFVINNQYNYEVRTTAYYVVEPDRLVFEVRIVNNLDRVLRLEGTLVRFNVDGQAVTLPDDSGVDEMLCGFLAPREQREYTINGPQTSELPFSDLGAQIPDLFQISSSVAAAGLVRGCAASFGFPRPDGSGFLDALRKTYLRFGEGTPRSTTPIGVSRHTKDGGIDVVAWRDWPDGLPGKLYLLGQCASGKNWMSKSVSNFVGNFYGDWLSLPPASPVVSAMFIPFTADRRLDVAPGESYGDHRAAYYLSKTRSLGILVDRLRIPTLVRDVLADQEALHREIDGIEDLPRVGEWVGALLDRVNA